MTIQPNVPMSVLERLERGELFNAYQTADGSFWLVGIGPVTGFLEIGRAYSADGANVLVDSLRIAFGQPAQLVRAEDYDDDGN